METAFFEGWQKGLGLLIDPLQIDGIVERDNSVGRQAVVLADALPHSVRDGHDAVGRPVRPPQEPVFEGRETARAEGYVERRVGAHDRNPRGGPKPTGAGPQERHFKVAFAEDVDPLAAQQPGQIPKLLESDASGESQPRGRMTVPIAVERHVVRHGFPQLPLAIDGVEQGLEVRSIKSLQDLENLPLAAAVAERAEEKQDTNAIDHCTAPPTVDFLSGCDDSVVLVPRRRPLPRRRVPRRKRRRGRGTRTKKFGCGRRPPCGLRSLNPSAARWADRQVPFFPIVLHLPHLSWVRRGGQARAAEFPADETQAVNCSLGDVPIGIARAHESTRELR